MPETITVHDDLEIIEVHSFGQVTKEDLLQSLQAVDQIYQTRGYNKVLIDAQEEEGIPNTIDLFMFSASMEKAYIGKTGRFAVVISEATRKDLEFLAKTTQKRGMKVNTFMSVDEAIDWLKG
jgi:predicted lipoprotein